MIKYNIIIRCYDKILVNVATYSPVYSALHTHIHVTRNYICGHIYQDFIVKAYYYMVFCHLMIHDFS